MFTTYTYASDGTLKTAVTALGKGADGVWGTADDLIGWSISYTYDEFGRVVTEMFSAAPGPDGAWGTADDEIDHYIRHFYLASGRLDRLEYDDSGADGLPGTADDVLGEIDTYTYDSANNLVKLVYGDASQEGGSYALTTYDAHDNRVSRTFYGDPGADQAWFTADDRVDSQRIFDTTK